ncbi:hypothetical protein HYV64_04425 [Candidatus Shapirobacteria bacterium]|nr:hypothetical protein [Candidatus Shapirobacteria bacterium]
MAGGSVTKSDPKKVHTKNFFGSESQPESQTNSSPLPPQKFSLRGILGIGQTIEFGEKSPSSKEIFSGISHLQHEVQVLFDQRQKDLEKALVELRSEIAKLANNTDNLEKSVENIAINEITDISEYQVNFFIRIRNFIATVRQSISETCLWVQAFASKKKKRNYFWNTAKNKKKGGDAFMFSDESGVSRSIG